MEKYADALAEVDVILYYLDEEDYNKIPKEVIEIIQEYKNEDYIFEYDETIELKDQDLLTETRAILYNFFRDYLASPTQSEKIKQWQMEDRKKNEVIKQDEYEYKEIFTNKNQEKVKEEKTELIEYKENIFKRIFNKIKSIFS